MHLLFLLVMLDLQLPMVVKMASLEPLDEYMSSDEFNKDDLLPVFTEPNIIDGKAYGLPAYGISQIMYFNTKVFEAAGVDPDEAFSY